MDEAVAAPPAEPFADAAETATEMFEATEAFVSGVLHEQEHPHVLHVHPWQVQAQLHTPVAVACG